MSMQRDGACFSGLPQTTKTSAVNGRWVGQDHFEYCAKNEAIGEVQREAPDEYSGSGPNWRLSGLAWVALGASLQPDSLQLFCLTQRQETEIVQHGLSKSFGPFMSYWRLRK